MISRKKKFWLSSTRAIRNLWGRLRLRNRSVSIISNDCWGGRMSKFYKLPFNSPFIGLFICGPDYVEILEHPEVLDLELRFFPIKESRYIDFLRKVDQLSHPVAHLGDTDLEIHFLHYENEETARQKWSRRVKRIDWTNAIVKFSCRDICDDNLIRRFDRLPYEQKVCFTPHRVEGATSAVYLPEFEGEERVSLCWNVSNLHWSFVRHANTLLKRGAQ